MYLFKILELIGFDIDNGLGEANVLMFHPRLAQRIGGVNAALLLIGLTELERVAVFEATLQQNIKYSDTSDALVNIFSNLWYEATDKTITHVTGLSKGKQRTAFKKLRERGLIWEELRGLPRRRFVRVNFIQLVEFLK